MTSRGRCTSGWRSSAALSRRKQPGDEAELAVILEFWAALLRSPDALQRYSARVERRLRDAGQGRHRSVDGRAASTGDRGGPGLGHRAGDAGRPADLQAPGPRHRHPGGVRARVPLLADLTRSSKDSRSGPSTPLHSCLLGGSTRSTRPFGMIDLGLRGSPAGVTNSCDDRSPSPAEGLARDRCPARCHPLGEHGHERTGRESRLRRAAAAGAGDPAGWLAPALQRALAVASGGGGG